MFMVMTLHLGISTSPDKFIAGGVYISAIAIPLFFLVSGWLMIDKPIGGGYLIRKIGRIFRFVTIISLIGAVCSFWIPMLNYEGIGWGLKKIILIIINPYLQKGIFSVFWYLGAMIVIYALLPIFNLAYRKYGLIGLYFIAVCLFIIECFVFQLNVLYNFEERFVLQAFRIWNWLFYFIMGAIIKRRFSKNNLTIGWGLPISLAFLYVLYAHMIIPLVHTWEYLYASPMCMLYSIIVFVYIVNIKISNKILIKIISFFSNLFLPVYALHIIILLCLRNMPNIGLGIIKPEVYLFLVWFITIIISWIIIKIPIVRSIFRI